MLRLRCPDRPGIVHAVTGFLVEHGGNIIQSQQYGDADTGRFFLRVHFEVADAGADIEGLRAAFVAVAERFSMDVGALAGRSAVPDPDHGVEVRPLPQRPAVSVEHRARCRSRSRRSCPTTATSRSSPSSTAIPFHHIPVTPETKEVAEQQLLELVDELDIDLVVLARYMQVLSNDTCRALSGKAINIHHSFLPSFKGARPYHQAHHRGVKLIGATAHYVTSDLDEGPIIEQDVARVDHGFTADELVRAGRDVECQVLSRAVRWHCETRVMLNDTKTVVFR